MRQLLYILLFVFLCPLAVQGQDVSVFHYNLFSNGSLKGKVYREEKEMMLLNLLKNNKGAALYSVLENGESNFFAEHRVFSLFGNYEVEQMESFNLQHFLIFDKNKIVVQKSLLNDSTTEQFFYYKLQLQGVVEPVHLVVYKQDFDGQQRKMYNGIFEFLQKEGIRENIILLGGSLVPIKQSRESVSSLFCKDYQLVNPNTATYLFDDDCEINEHNDIDFVFYSKDLGVATKASELKYSRVKKMQTWTDVDYKALRNLTDNRPISFKLQKRRAAKANCYKIPQLDIVLQNKTSLECSLVWDKDTELSVEVVTIIGNVLYSENFNYEGEQKELVLNLSSFSTGIYLLKARDSEGRTVVRKITKY